MTDDPAQRRTLALEDAYNHARRAGAALRAAHEHARDPNDAGRLAALHAAANDLLRELERLR